MMNIVIADDHPLFRSGVTNLIHTTDDLVIVGEASTGTEAVALAEKLQPNVVIMDIRMPDMNGVEATRKIKERYPDIHIMVLSLHKDDQSVFAALKAGATGYMLKESDGAELLQSIRLVGSGNAVYSASIAAKMMSFFTQASQAAVASSSYLSALTGREREILKKIAEGDTNNQIAAALHLSAKTVANHVSSILSKLQLVDRHMARQWMKSREAEQQEL
jgi:DNA-binding NarL/FixJ family response regulator